MVMLSVTIVGHRNVSGLRFRDNAVPGVGRYGVKRQNAHHAVQAGCFCTLIVDECDEVVVDFNDLGWS